METQEEPTGWEAEPESTNEYEEAGRTDRVECGAGADQCVRHTLLGSTR
jgi:hypothetical protein